MGSGPVWKDEHKEQLYELYAGGVTVEDIARKMHRTPAAITSAVVKARTGKWGDDYKQRFNACLDGRRAAMNGNQKENKIAREDPQLEEDVPEEEPEPIPETVCTPFREEDGRIDMIQAIDVLVACARMFCMDELVEVRGSNHHERAGVIFTAGGHTYTLSLAFNEED